MPWYTNPVMTCKVLNRIANRHQRTSLSDLDSIMDHATQLLWSKQEQFYSLLAANKGNCRGRSN